MLAPLPKHRQPLSNPPPQKREVPTMASRKLNIMNPEDAEDPEAEDPQEMAEDYRVDLADIMEAIRFELDSQRRAA